MMKRSKRIVGVSLKMYFSHARTVQWSRALEEVLFTHPAVQRELVEFFVAPTFPSLISVRDALPSARIAAQNVAAESFGAFTGEVSPAVLREIGCDYVEIGHAERRRLFAENDAVIAAKVDAALAEGLIPLICIGEEESRDTLSAVNSCVAQIRAALTLAQARGRRGRALFAYEPIWAIGADAPAPPDYIQRVCRDLSDELKGFAPAFDAAVIYGGSAGPGLLSLLGDSVHGLFLGRFAHDPHAVREVLDEVVSLADSAPSSNDQIG